jgi:hypothetical protein
MINSYLEMIPTSKCNWTSLLSLFDNEYNVNKNISCCSTYRVADPFSFLGKDWFLKIKISISLYLFGCFACMFVCASHVCSVQGGQKRALHSLGTSVTNHCELPRGCWDLNLGSLGEQPELLTAELLFSTYVMEEC